MARKIIKNKTTEFMFTEFVTILHHVLAPGNANVTLFKGKNHFNISVSIMNEQGLLF